MNIECRTLSHHHIIDMQPVDEKIQQKALLSATILEYYQKYGKNRRLEKYLRLREPIDCPDELQGAGVHISKNSPGAEKSSTVKYPEDFEQTSISESAEDLKRSETSKDAESQTNENVRPCPSTSGGLLDSSVTDVDEREESQGPDDSKSPRKSKKSNRRLEWDSLGDVGYRKPGFLSRKTDAGVPILETTILDEMFANQRKQYSSAAGRASINFVNLPAVHTGQPENWRQTLESIKKKYNSLLLDTSAPFDSTCFNSRSFSKRSTPKTGTVKPSKSVQTSKIHQECKEIQVNISKNSSPLNIAGNNCTSCSGSYSSSTVNTSISQSCQDIKQQNKQTVSTSPKRYNEEKKEKKVQRDIELGINLLCSLIESKNLSTRKKKLLVQKIVSRISHNDAYYEKDGISSASSTTNSTTTKSGEFVNSRTIGKQPLLQSNSFLGKTSSSLAVSPASFSKNVDALSKYSTLRKSNVQRQQQVEKIIEREYIPTIQDPRPQSTTTVQPEATWLDPMTKSELKYEKCHGSVAALVDQKTTGDFVPTGCCQFIPAETKVVLVDEKAGGDFIRSRHCRHSGIFEFITNEHKSHFNWIENEIQHLENLKKLLLSNQQKTVFTPLDVNQQVYSLKLQKLFPTKNDYDMVASSSGAPSLESAHQILPTVYHETNLVSEKEVVDPAELYQRNQIRREKEVLYDDVLKDSTVGTITRSVGKNVSLEIQEEKRFPKRNYLHNEQHVEKQLRSKLKTPTENLAEFANNRKQQFLERCKNQYSQKVGYEHCADNGHYSEPHEKSVSKPNPMGSDVGTTTTSSNLVSSESMSIPDVTTSTTTTTHQYDHCTGIGVQTTESLLQTCKISGKQDGPTIRTYHWGHNKQTQTKPQSVAYVLNFDTSYRSDSSPEMRLQEYLEKHRPDFTEHTNQRSIMLNELRQRRKERGKQVREIIESTSISTISMKLKELPPPPTKYTRIFVTKEMKAITKNKYSQLPEVVERSQQLKIERRKKSNRIILDVFNKRMQQRVRKGKLNLEHSMTII